MGTPKVQRLALALAVATWVLICLGACSISSHLPIYSQIHRLTGRASLLGAVALVAGCGIWQAPKALKIGAAAILAGFVAEAGLGEMHRTGLLHAVIAHALFTGTVLMAMQPREAASHEQLEDSGWPSLRSLATGMSVLLIVQVVLGAGYRHHNLPALPHVIGSIAVTASVLIVSIFVLAQFGSHASLRRPAMALLVLTCVQVVLGILAYLFRLNAETSGTSINMVLFTAGHVATGALTLAAGMALTLEIARNVRHRPPQAAGALSTIAR